MPGRNQYLAHLAALPLFSACSKRELQKIARAGDEIEVEPGRVVVDQGEAGREAFLIIEGQAAVRRNGRKIATLGPGDQFGELALLDRGPRTAAIVAEKPMRLFVLSSREFAGVLDEVPTITHKLMAALASRIRQLDRQAYG